MHSTDLAEWLVKQGVPFRQAHEKVGKLVAYCQSNSLELNEIDFDKLKELIPEAKKECLSLFSPQSSIEKRNSEGGTSPDQVAKQLDFWKREFNDRKKTS